LQKEEKLNGLEERLMVVMKAFSDYVIDLGSKSGVEDKVARPQCSAT